MIWCETSTASTARSEFNTKWTVLVQFQRNSRVVGLCCECQTNYRVYVTSLSSKTSHRHVIFVFSMREGIMDVQRSVWANN